jgi:hypothetical protein
MVHTRLYEYNFPYLQILAARVTCETTSAAASGFTSFSINAETKTLGSIFPTLKPEQLGSRFRKATSREVRVLRGIEREF